MLVDSILVRLLHSIIDLPNGCLISTPVAIVRGRKDSYNAHIVLPLVSFHAKLMRPGNVALFLDGIAEGDAGWRRTGVERHLDFGNGSAVEVRAERGQELEDLWRRVRLDCVVDRAVRQGVTEGAKIVAHDVEVDHEAGTFGTSGVDEVEDASSGHRCNLPNSSDTRSCQASDGQRTARHRSKPVGGDTGTVRTLDARNIG